MADVDRAFLVERIISLATAPLILIVLLTHLLPARLTTLPARARLRAPSVSLLLCVLVRALLVVLDERAQADIVSSGSASGSLCVADAALEAFWTAALAAHIPLIVYTLNAGHPTIEHPNPHPRHTPLLLCLVWAYALLPAVPLLASLVVQSGSDGKWWGYYCHSTVWWWRPLRSASLFAPLLLGLILLVPLTATLYSLSGTPTPEIRSTKRQWTASIFLLLVISASIAYLVLEQAIGWSADWWPRAAEAAPTPLAIIAYASHPDLWRVWLAWLRLRRPRESSSIERAGQPASPKSTNSGKSSSKSKRSQPHQRTSSFWSAPPTNSPPNNPPPKMITSQGPVNLSSPTQSAVPAPPLSLASTVPAELRRPIHGISPPPPPPPPILTASKHRPTPSQDEARSPPFTYSLALSALSNDTFGSGLDVLAPPLGIPAPLVSTVKRLSGGAGSVISEASKYSDTTSAAPSSQPTHTMVAAPRASDREERLVTPQRALLPPAPITTPRVESPSVVGSDRSLVSGGTFGTRTPGHAPRQPPPFGYASRLKYGEEGYRERLRLSKQRNVTWEKI